MLRIQGKEDPTNAWDVSQARLTIGRDEINDIVISDEAVSGFHANFFFENSRLYIVDVGSSNGVHHNGERINSKVELRPWDVIRVGSTELEIIDPDARKATVQQDAITDDMIAMQKGKS